MSCAGMKRGGETDAVIITAGLTDGHSESSAREIVKVLKR